MRSTAKTTRYIGRGNSSNAAGAAQKSEKALLYEEYIKSDHWRAVRKRYRESKLPWECAVCGVTVNLHLHHRTYKRIGQERLADLVPLCQFHHEQTHQLVRAGVQLWDAHRRLSPHITVIEPAQLTKGWVRSRKKIKKQRTVQKAGKPTLGLWCGDCHKLYAHGHKLLRCECGGYVVYRPKTEAARRLARRRYPAGK